MNPFNSRWGLLAVALTLIALCGAFVLIIVPVPHPIGPATGSTAENPLSNSMQLPGTQPTTGTPATQDLSDLIVVDSPVSGATIASSSLTITGKARGSFYSEAVFPVYLTDANGNTIAQGQAHAQGDWMTTDFVPFTATLTFTKPASGSRGTLILHNDNPSGDPARDKAFSIPVTFQ
jgi:hypothetical protein